MTGDRAAARHEKVDEPQEPERADGYPQSGSSHPQTVASVDHRVDLTPKSATCGDARGPSAAVFAGREIRPAVTPLHDG
jgi:hypothetical protein